MKVIPTLGMRLRCGVMLLLAHATALGVTWLIARWIPDIVFAPLLHFLPLVAIDLGGAVLLLRRHHIEVGPDGFGIGNVWGRHRWPWSEIDRVEAVDIHQARHLRVTLIDGRCFHAGSNLVGFADDVLASLVGASSPYLGAPLDAEGMVVPPGVSADGREAAFVTPIPTQTPGRRAVQQTIRSHVAWMAAVGRLGFLSLTSAVVFGGLAGILLGIAWVGLRWETVRRVEVDPDGIDVADGRRSRRILLTEVAAARSRGSGAIELTLVHGERIALPAPRRGAIGSLVVDPWCEAKGAWLIDAVDRFVGGDLPRPPVSLGRAVSPHTVGSE